MATRTTATMPIRRLAVIACLAALGALTAATASAQFGRGFFGTRVATEGDFDGRFNYCRVMYRPAFSGFGGNWTTDYPRADINMSIRLGELTKTRVAFHASGDPKHLVVRLSGDELFQCPLVIMSAPGRALIEETDAVRLREYLLKGGILWVDDFWGSYQWEHWAAQIRKVFPPSEHPIVDIPLDHALFRTQYVISEIPQIPNIGFYMRSGGGTSEQGADSAVPHVRGILDADGRIMVLMTHNTDIADAWEREGDDPSYFYAFSPKGYAFGINAILYALTH
jgi:hypothetical protein